MGGPYRHQGLVERDLVPRRCPWCSAEASVDAQAVTAVCAACGARFATELPTQVEAPPTSLTLGQWLGRLCAWCFLVVWTLLWIYGIFVR